MNKFNNIGKKLPGLLSIVALFLLLGLSVQILHQKKDCRVSQLLVTIDDFQDRTLISADDINEILEKQFKALNNRKISLLDLSLIEDLLRENKFVNNAEAYVDNANRLHIEIWTKKPFSRLYLSSSESVYLSIDGEVLPTTGKHIVKVPLITGATFGILDTINSVRMEKLLFLMKEIEKDDFLSALIEQVHFLSVDELELIPKIGRAHILFGELDDIESKLNKLSVFYRKTAQKLGLNSFETINLKIKGQVVCEVDDERT